MIRRLFLAVLVAATFVVPSTTSGGVAAQATVVAPDGAVLISGLDLHDGQVVKWSEWSCQ